MMMIERCMAPHTIPAAATAMTIARQDRAAATFIAQGTASAASRRPSRGSPLRNSIGSVSKSLARLRRGPANLSKNSEMLLNARELSSLMRFSFPFQTENQATRARVHLAP